MAGGHRRFAPGRMRGLAHWNPGCDLPEVNQICPAPGQAVAVRFYALGVASAACTVLVLQWLSTS